MQIQKSGAGELTITGNIKSIDDSASIRRAVDDLLQGGSKRLHLRVAGSFSMTSAVIGYLMKVVNHDGVNLSMEIEDARLYSLLESLNLLECFGVRLGGHEFAANPRGLFANPE